LVCRRDSGWFCWQLPAEGACAVPCPELPRPRDRYLPDLFCHRPNRPASCPAPPAAGETWGSGEAEQTHVLHVSVCCQRAQAVWFRSQGADALQGPGLGRAALAALVAPAHQPCPVPGGRVGAGGSGSSLPARPAWSSGFFHAAGDSALTGSALDQRQVMIHFPSVFKQGLFLRLLKERGDCGEFACSPESVSSCRGQS